MAFIEWHDELATHPKLYKLMEQLNMKRRDTLGLLGMFWSWSLKSAPSGDITEIPLRAIADATDWNKNPRVLLDALVKCHWIDKSEDGRLTIHDWDEFTWRYFDKVEQTKEQTRKRVAEYRKRKKSLQSNDFNVTHVTHEHNDVTQCNAPTSTNTSTKTYIERERRAHENDAEIEKIISEIGKLYEDVVKSPIPAALSEDISFRLREGTDPALIKEALRTSLGKQNISAYFKAIMQSWTAQGIRTSDELMKRTEKAPLRVDKTNSQPDYSDPSRYSEEDIPEWTLKPQN